MNKKNLIDELEIALEKIEENLPAVLLGQAVMKMYENQECPVIQCLVSLSKKRYVSISHNSFRYFGYKPKEMIGRETLGFIYQPDLPQTLRVIEETKDNTSNFFQNSILHKDGKKVQRMDWWWSGGLDEDLVFVIGFPKDVIMI